MRSTRFSTGTDLKVRRALIATIVAAGVLVFVNTSRAEASGSYVVKQCGWGEHAGKAWGWGYNGNTGYQIGESACPGNGLAMWSMGGLTFWSGQIGTWRLNAPANVTITGWSMVGRHWTNGLIPAMWACSGNSCSIAWTSGGAAPCGYYESAGGTSGAFNNLRIDYGPWGNATPICNGRIRGLNFTINAVDHSNPAFTGYNGSLLTGGWKKGNQSLFIGSTDSGSGVREIAYQVERYGVERWYGSQHCSTGQGGQYDNLNACPSYQWLWYTINTAGYSDGCHAVRGVSREATGNVYYGGYAGFCSDNTPPGAPRDLRVEGGETWRSSDSFNLQWAVPDQGNGSGIAKVKYQVGSGPVQEKTSGNMWELDNISTGSPGSHQIRVWLEDAAGNQTSANAEAAQLMFDDVEPGESRVDIVDGYINAGELGNEKAGWQPVSLEEVPVSGIAGYAVSFDRDEGGDPGIHVTHPGKDTLQTTIPADLPEGKNYIHVRAVSNSGVGGPVDTQAIKVDKTPPRLSIEGVPDGWVKGSLDLRLAASDNYSGIDPGSPGSGVVYSMDGGSSIMAQGAQAALGIYGTGEHTVTAYAQDVAGNRSEVKRYKARIDNKPPVLGFHGKNQDRPTVVRAKAVDEHSGFKQGTVYYRIEGSPEWKLLPTTYNAQTQELVGEIDDDRLPEDKRVEYLARGTDNVGNEGSSDLDLEGNKYFDLTPIKFGSYFRNDFGDGLVFERPASNKACRALKKRLRARVRSACGRKKKEKGKGSLRRYATELTVGYGKRVWVRGRLVDRKGRGVVGAGIDIGTAATAQTTGDRIYRMVGSTKTSANGVFRYRLSKGGGRHVKAFYAGSPKRRRAESKAITLYVKSKVSFRLSPRRVRNGRRVKLCGTVFFRGDRLPPRGKIVEVQFRNRVGRRARWQTFRTIRTRGRRGRFRTSHKFKFIANPQRIKFRVRVPTESGWSYSTATSRPRSVTVYPRR